MSNTLKRLVGDAVKRLKCWWFGCEPDYLAWSHQMPATPCLRCGAPDCDYADMVGFTRHFHFMRFLSNCRYWLLFGWVPRRCRECGEWPGKCDCPPF
ncbi:hypothetical protein [Paraburkholderia sp. J10-1]|uniref:hypothetical protein n=1 Tax=Paraburkholderia sp. J10-1 TaxID=2805430 RepID=UPI002AB7294C|nr:hypothetical protein [Paraburkholderia sp. J10-1]